MIKIMFVCTGNICRSAMAHKMMEKMIEETEKDIEVYSCGTFAEDGDRSTHEAIQIMEDYDIDLKSHKAINIRKADVKEMDIILCATTAHKINVINMQPEVKEKTYTIKEYAGYNINDLDIKDPWGYNLEIYRRCANEIDICLKKIIENI